jgi:glutamate 5-kinase
MIGMRGTIVIGNDAGRALRRKPATIRVADVLYCAGGFCPGDIVHIAFRTTDGSQYVVAKGIASCDHAELQKAVGAWPRTADTSETQGSAEVVVREQDIRLLWPPR